MDEARLLAEQAVLGSMLLSAGSSRRVLTWLRPEDFVDPWHQDVLRALREHPQQQGSLPEQIGARLIARGGPDRAHVHRIADLLRAAPPRPDPAVYGRMVLETSLRGTLAGLGVILRAAALSASGDGGPDPLTSGIQIVRRALGDARDRWRVANAPDTGDGVPAGGLEAVWAAQEADARRLIDTRSSADRFIRRHPPTDLPRMHDQEVRFIAALVNRPERVPVWIAAIDPTEIITRRWRPVYRALADLAQTDSPIDAVTVAWQYTREARRHGPGPPLADFRAALDAGVCDDPDYHGHRVVSDRLRRVSDDVTDQFTEVADNRLADVDELLGFAERLVTGIEQVAEHLPPAGRARSGPIGRIPTQAAGPTGPAAG